MLSKRLVGSLLDGALQDHPTYVGGQYRGYYIIIDHNYNTNQQRLQICAHSDNDPGNVQLLSYLQSLRSENSWISGITAEPYSFTLDLALGMNRKLVELLDPLIRKIVMWLQHGAYQSGCAWCGGAYNVACYTINDRNMYLCPSCLEDVKAALDLNKKELRSHKSNLLHGFAGAVIGAFVGGIAYVLLSKVGYVAAITGVLMAFLSLLLYERFGGCLDVKGIICCAAVLIATVYFANKAAWTWEAYDALKEYGWSLREVFSQLGYILEQTNLKADYFKDLGMGYLFTAIGAVGRFVRAFRSSTGKYTIRKN